MAVQSAREQAPQRAPRRCPDTGAHVRRYVAITICGILTSAVALGAAAFGNGFVGSHTLAFAESLAHSDGQHYISIVTGGYTYTPGRGSRVAFFPAFPLAARGAKLVLHIDNAAALALVSNLCFLAAFVAMSAYGERRRAELGLRPNPLPSRGVEGSAMPRQYALLAVGLLPTTSFFRMSYSESTFLLSAILAFYAMARRWPLPVIAVLVGLASAVRPVGVALLLPMAWHVARQSESRAQAARRLIFLGPLACWGLLAYMAFQYWKFGQPVAFALTQADWRVRSPGTLQDKVLSLLSWQPVWSVYVPGSWGYYGGTPHPEFNLRFANPIYFVGTAVLVALGAWKRWLTAEEVLLSVGLLAIPYVTRAYEMCMASQGRFAAVVFPAYIVMGELLARVPTVVAVSLLAASACLMAAYAALFAAGYPLI